MVFRYFLVGLALLMSLNTARSLLREADRLPHRTTEFVDTAAAVNMVRSGLYFNSSVFGHPQNKRPFSPYISSGFLTTWPSGVGWVLGKNLFSARVASAFAGWFFALGIFVAFLRRRNYSWPAACALASVLWYASTLLPFWHGYIYNLGELQAVLWLALGFLFLYERPAFAFFCFGVSFWLGKVIFIPAIFALAFVYGMNEIRARGRAAVNKVARDGAFFFLPLVLWLAYIFVRRGPADLIVWAHEYVEFLGVGHRGVDAAALELSLAERLALPFNDFYTKAVFWGMLFLPSLLTLRATLLLGGIKQIRTNLVLQNTWALLLVIWLFYIWFLTLNPMMWLRHIQPAFYLGFGLVAYFALLRAEALKREFPQYARKFTATTLVALALSQAAWAWKGSIHNPYGLARTYAGDIETGNNYKARRRDCTNIFSGMAIAASVETAPRLERFSPTSVTDAAFPFYLMERRTRLYAHNFQLFRSPTQSNEAVLRLHYTTEVAGEAPRELSRDFVVEVTSETDGRIQACTMPDKNFMCTFVTEVLAAESKYCD